MRGEKRVPCVANDARQRSTIKKPRRLYDAGGERCSAKSASVQEAWALPREKKRQMSRKKAATAAG